MNVTRNGRQYVAVETSHGIRLEVTPLLICSLCGQESSWASQIPHRADCPEAARIRLPTEQQAVA